MKGLHQRVSTSLDFLYRFLTYLYRFLTFLAHVVSVIRNDVRNVLPAPSLQLAFKRVSTNRSTTDGPSEELPDSVLVRTALFYTVALLNESQEPNEESRHVGNFTISPWVLSALNHVSSISQPPEARDKSVSQMREEIASAQSEIAVCNALFELGCLLSVARSLYADVFRVIVYICTYTHLCLDVVLGLLCKIDSMPVWPPLAVLTPLVQIRSRALWLRSLATWMSLGSQAPPQDRMGRLRESLWAGESVYLLCALPCCANAGLLIAMMLAILRYDDDVCYLLFEINDPSGESLAARRLRREAPHPRPTWA